MQIARDYLFSGTRLAGDHHANIAIGHLRHHRPHSAHRQTGTNQVVIELAVILPQLQLAVSRLALLAVKLRLMQHVEQLALIQRQPDPGHQHPAQRRTQRLRLNPGREEKYRHMRISRLQLR